MFSINGKQAIIIVNAKCFFLFDITLPTMPKAKEIIPNIPNIIQLNPCKVHSIPTNAQYTLIKEVDAKRMAAMAVGSILNKTFVFADKIKRRANAKAAPAKPSITVNTQRTLFAV
jgi:hypothetical protein